MGYGGYTLDTPPQSTPPKGGFSASNAFNSPTDSPKNRSNIQQTLRPVTILQLMNANSAYADAPLQVDGTEISQICVIGRVNTCSINASNFMYTIDDSTGTIEVRHYSDSDEENKVASHPEGSIVKVIGQVRVFNNRKMISAHHIKQVDSLDEFCHHLLSVVSVHMGATTKQHNTINHAHLTPLQNQILNMASKNETDVRGTHVSVFVNGMRGITHEDEIRNQLQWLVGQGHLYCPEDDEHFKCCDDE